MLARSGTRIWVPPDKTVLETLEAQSIDVSHSCREGLCGACETRVLSGTSEHRDFVLSRAEMDEGNKMMICRSRSFTPELQLDL